MPPSSSSAAAVALSATVNASAHQTSGSYRTLNVRDALSYLDQVKLRFHEQNDVYNQFLEVMKLFKTQSIDTPGVIERVSTLFRGYPSLIQGFNTFLPPGFRIECSLLSRLPPSLEQADLVTVFTPGQSANKTSLFPRDGTPVLTLSDHSPGSLPPGWVLATPAQEPARPNHSESARDSSQKAQVASHSDPSSLPPPPQTRPKHPGPALSKQSVLPAKPCPPPPPPPASVPLSDSSAPPTRPNRSHQRPSSPPGANPSTTSQPANRPQSEVLPENLNNLPKKQLANERDAPVTRSSTLAALKPPRPISPNASPRGPSPSAEGLAAPGPLPPRRACSPHNDRRLPSRLAGPSGTSSSSHNPPSLQRPPPKDPVPSTSSKPPPVSDKPNKHHSHSKTIRPAPPAGPHPSSSTNQAQPVGAGLNNSNNNNNNKPVEFNYAINYVNKIKHRFLDQPETYKTFLEILQTYQRDGMPIDSVYVKVTKLFSSATDLLDEFKQFLPDLNASSSTTPTAPAAAAVPGNSSASAAGGQHSKTGQGNASVNKTSAQTGQLASSNSTGAPLRKPSPPQQQQQQQKTTGKSHQQQTSMANQKQSVPRLMSEAASQHQVQGHGAPPSSMAEPAALEPLPAQLAKKASSTRSRTPVLDPQVVSSTAPGALDPDQVLNTGPAARSKSRASTPAPPQPDRGATATEGPAKSSGLLNAVFTGLPDSVLVNQKRLLGNTQATADEDPLGPPRKKRALVGALGTEPVQGATRKASGATDGSGPASQLDSVAGKLAPTKAKRAKGKTSATGRVLVAEPGVRAKVEPGAHLAPPAVDEPRGLTPQAHRTHDALLGDALGYIHPQLQLLHDGQPGEQFGMDHTNWQPSYVETHDAMGGRTLTNTKELALFEAIKRYLGDEEVWVEFLRVLELYNSSVIDFKTLLERVYEFIGDEDGLVEEFKGLVGYDVGTDGLVEEEEWEIKNVAVQERDKVDASLISREYGPSYKRLPRAEIDLACSGRDALCWSVLNDEYFGAAKFGTESGGPGHRKTNFEEVIAMTEGERAHFSYWLECISRTIGHFEAVLVRIEAMDERERASFTLGDNLGGLSPSIYHRTLRKVYENKYQSNILPYLRDYPSSSVPIVLRRLKELELSWKAAEAQWSVIWREVERKNYYKAQDHQVVTFKANEKALLKGTNLLKELHDLKENKKTLVLNVAVEEEEKGQEEQVPMEIDGGLGNENRLGEVELQKQIPEKVEPQPRPIRPSHQLELGFQDIDVFFDVLRIIIMALDRSGLSNPERRRIDELIRTLIPALWNIPPGELERQIPIIYDDEASEASEEAPGDQTGQGERDVVGQKGLESLTEGLLKIQTGQQEGRRGRSRGLETPLSSPPMSSQTRGRGGRESKATTAVSRQEELGEGTSQGQGLERLRSFTGLKKWIDIMIEDEEEDGEGEDEGERVEQDERAGRWYNVFGTSTYYLLIRLIHTLYSRLLKLKTLGLELSRRRPIWRRVNPVGHELGLSNLIIGLDDGKNPGEGLYGYCLDQLSRMFDGEIDCNKFEEACRVGFQGDGYRLVGIEKLVNLILKQFSQIHQESKNKEILNLLRRERSLGSIDPMVQVGYRFCCEEVLFRNGNGNGYGYGEDGEDGYGYGYGYRYGYGYGSGYGSGYGYGCASGSGWDGGEFGGRELIRAEWHPERKSMSIQVLRRGESTIPIKWNERKRMLKHYVETYSHECFTELMNWVEVEEEEEDHQDEDQDQKMKKEMKLLKKERKMKMIKNIRGVGKVFRRFELGKIKAREEPIMVMMNGGIGNNSNSNTGGVGGKKEVIKVGVIVENASSSSGSGSGGKVWICKKTFKLKFARAGKGGYLEVMVVSGRGKVYEKLDNSSSSSGDGGSGGFREMENERERVRSEKFDRWVERRRSELDELME